MESIRKQLEALFTQAITAAFDTNLPPSQGLIQYAKKQIDADYQSNASLILARQLDQPPQTIGQQIIDHLPSSALINTCSLSGPGFINIKLHNDFISQTISQMFQDPHLGVKQTSCPDNIVVDYGSPNVAKAMHVGHLRSTIIGDAIVRLLTFTGHQVIRQNHIGDWGTQFGMLIEHLLDQSIDMNTLNQMTQLNTLYQQAKQRFDQDSHFADAAKKRVVALQSGDQTSLKIWHQLVQKSQQHFQGIYEQLGVLLTTEDIRGESCYNDDLPKLIDDLTHRDYLTKSQGAKVMFLDGFTDQEDNPLPMILQKSDGGYLYATTDMATAKYRVNTLKAKRLIYVTDCRQKQHFDMLFAALRHVGYATDDVRLDYEAFGTILGADHKPFKTRSGQNIELEALIDEAKQRALTIYQAKNPGASATETTHIAHTVGISALKYADLRNDKMKDYVFDWDIMLAFDGNTAPYLLNAYVRIASLLRKAGNPNIANNTVPTLNTPYERELAAMVTQFPELVHQLVDDLAIHRLCTYLFDIAAQFHRFYEHCPILNQDAPLRTSRLQLCQITQAILKKGLSLLGISTLEFM